MTKHKYQVEEYSQDARHFIVESDFELTDDELRECISNVAFNDGDTFEDEINDTPYKVTFKGTEYGDDCDINIRKIKGK
jgi:hypothetical protein